MSTRNFLRYNSDFFNKYYPAYFGTGSNISKFDKLPEKAYSSFFSDKKFLNMLGLESNFTFETKYFKDLNNPYKSSIMIEYNFFLSEMMMLKVDTTSMANSLEIRSPFVDHKLVEYIVSLNTDSNSQTFNKAVFKRPIRKRYGQSIY